MDLALWPGRGLNAWAVLVTAGVLEVLWLVALKRSVSAAQPLYGVASVAMAWLSFALLRWLRFAWTAIGSGGLWLGKVRSAAAQA